MAAKQVTITVFAFLAHSVCGKRTVENDMLQVDEASADLHGFDRAPIYNQKRITLSRKTLGPIGANCSMGLTAITEMYKGIPWIPLPLVAPKPGSRAENAGVKAGRLLYKMNGLSLHSFAHDQVTSLMAGLKARHHSIDLTFITLMYNVVLPPRNLSSQRKRGMEFI
eukprot:gnl/MRDRNA2_/MRDRNA2_30549_c0_seq1.p1 gnl/MRDRNA2_/MRDRNA2_30549_c0~~gnl/MRDRNA2_/MRDRNA2_30549_c0_seq1.p1  ORF type:complete len:167 (-),score=22.73 gnl/MRDRNA2_/MRDRNA2_30549_c0_seq1:743-1243(-)